MTHQGYLRHVAQVAHVGYDLLGILYLVGHGHVLKLSLALTVTVEVEADGGHTVTLQRVGNKLKERTVLGASETMTEHHHGALLSGCQLRLLDDGLQTAVVAVNGQMLTLSEGRVCCADRHNAQR